MKQISIKERALKYRRSGYSYGMISQELGLAKSTLSDWLKEVPYKPSVKVIERIGIGKLKSAQFKHNQRIQDIELMRNLAWEELGSVTKRDLWLLGIGLYLGEGSKINENIRIINSDPAIIQIAIKWFKDVCGLTTENFMPCLHLYPDTDLDSTLKFWAKITNIPRDKFGKTQIDKRTNKALKKRGKLPYGTLHLYIKSCGKKEFGRSLHRRIMGWIEACIGQINH